MSGGAGGAARSGRLTVGLGAGTGALVGLVLGLLVAFLVLGTDDVEGFANAEDLPVLYSLAAMIGIVVGVATGAIAMAVAVAVARGLAGPRGRAAGAAAAGGVGLVAVMVFGGAVVGPYGLLAAVLGALLSAGIAWQLLGRALPPSHE